MAAKVGFLNLPVEYRGVAESFRRKLRAENKSEHTIAAYSLAVRQFGEYLEVKGLPTDPVHITREHVESFLSDLLEAGCSCLPFPEV